MAQKIIKTRLVHRKDLSTKWSSVNPILLDGEMGIEKDTRKFKIGDGVTSWNDLPYANVTYDVFNSKFSIGNDENTPGTAPVRDDSNQIHVNTTSQSDSTVAVNKGYMEQHVEVEINKISQGGKVATLDESGKIPASQLPSYVDDIIEGQFISDYYPETSPFVTSLSTHVPITTGLINKLYFNFEKYKDNGKDALEKIFPDSNYGTYNLARFESGYILCLYHIKNYSTKPYGLSIINYINATSYTTLMTIYEDTGAAPTEPVEIPSEYGPIIEIYSENEHILHSINFMDFISPEPFPENDGTKDAGKIYVDIDNNKTYRWSGTKYVEISSSLALGETSSTAYAGNKGKQNADNIAALQTQVEGLQPKEDSALKTTNKKVPGAINELKQNQDTNSTNIQTNTTNITKLQQDLTAANISIASNFNRITDLEGVADEVLIEIEEINEKIAQGGGGGGTVAVEDSFVTVNELPETIVQLPGTPTPTGENVYIENLYFNTNLSVEEVKQIILNYCEENNLYDEYGTVNIDYIWGSDNKKQIKIKVSSGSGMYISDNAYPSFTYYWCDEQFANSNMGNYNITKVGWQDFENPLVIDGNASVPYKPMELFSITPLGEGFNPDIKEEKIYRLFHKEEPKWVGTPIPNTGRADGFYFNISLSVEEVEKIINTLDFSNGASDHEYQVMWFNTGMTSDDIKIEKFEDGAMRITSASGGNTYWCNQKYKDNYDTNIQNTGWGAGATSWNDEGYVRLYYEFYSTMYGNPVGDQNDKLSGLLSLTPFEYIEGKEGLDGYYRFKNNKWIKVLEDTLIVDVEELSSATIDTSTAVPSSGQVGKVYFNTKLSVEEVNEILNGLEYVEGVLSAPAVAIVTNADMSQGLVIMGGTSSFGSKIYMIVTGDGKAIYEYLPENQYSTPGWYLSEVELNIDNMLSLLASQVGMTIQNEKLKQLISITPFEAPNPDIQLDKLYRIPITESGEWVGTVVPNTGTVEKVYLNTALSDKEIDSLLSGVTYDQGMYGILQTTTNGLVLMSYDDANVILNSITYQVYWANQKFVSETEMGKELGITKSGWQIFDNPVEINDTVLSEFPDLDLDTIGLENVKLTNLISTTPFGSGEIKGYKYYHLVNGEWKELGSGNSNEGSGNTPIIIEKTVTDFSSSPTITDEDWELITTKEVVIVLKNPYGSVTLYKITNVTTDGLPDMYGVTFHTYFPFECYRTIKKTDSGYDVITNFSARVMNLKKNMEVSNGYLYIDYYRENDTTGTTSYPIDTETATDSDNLITSKAVRNYIAEYMSANYDNGDEEEF